MIRALTSSVLTAVLTLSAAAQDKPAAGEKRSITFHRNETKGSKYEVTARASVLRTMDAVVDNERNPAAKTVNFQITLGGELEVTNVTPKAGRVNGYQFKVKSVSLDEGATGTPSIKPGAVITAKPGKGGRTQLAVDGKDPESSIEEALDAALPEIVAVDEEADDCLAPEGPVAPGESWKPDIRRLAKLYADAGQTEVNPENSSVSARYKGPSTIAGDTCDVVVTSLDLTLSKVAGLPEGSTLKSATMASVSTDALSRNEKTAAPVNEKSTTDYEIHFETGDDGKRIEIIVKTHQEVERTMQRAR